MPTTLRTGPYRFYFYSYDCREPRHMHVDRESRSANSGWIPMSRWLQITAIAAESYVTSSALSVSIWRP
jgi:hypothetical protein